MRVLGVALAVLAASCVSAERLVGYAGFGHVVVLDKDSSRMAAYDLRTNPASPACDIMHFPPVAPPTRLGDYIVNRNPEDLRMFHTSGEMFTLMDGHTGAYVSYKCEGFKPFLAALPCKVFAIGEAPQFAGNKHVFGSGPGRVLVYDSASGDIVVHFIDADVETALAISKIPVGHVHKPLQTNLPVSGDVSLAVSVEQQLLFVYKPEKQSLKVFRYNTQADTVESLLGKLLHDSTKTLPSWVQQIISVENNMLLAYNPTTTQYMSVKVSVSSSGQLSFATSSVQQFASATRGFLFGHACLLDDRPECLATPGCGWCVTSQRCLHMGNDKPCDETCESWCHEDNMACFHADQAVKDRLGPRQNKTFDPALTSPKDVDAGLVLPEQTLHNNTLDTLKTAHGVDFDAPENNSVNCMNAGFKEADVDDEKGCNDNSERQNSRKDLLSAMEHMNSYKGSIQILDKDLKMTMTQGPPPSDCVEVDVDGTRPNLNQDAPLGNNEGNVPVPFSADGGRWNLATEVHPQAPPPDVEHEPVDLAPVRSPTHKFKPMTMRRLRKFKQILNAQDTFAPTQGATLSGHDMMNGHKSPLHTFEEGVINGQHVSDESIVKSVETPEDFMPKQGEITTLVNTAKFVVSGSLEFSDHFDSAWRNKHAPLVRAALAEVTGVKLNEVLIGEVERSDTGVRVTYSMNVGVDPSIANELSRILALGVFERVLVRDGFSAHLVSHSEPKLTIAGIDHPSRDSSTKVVTASSMESGCAEEGETDAADSSFMNGASMSDTRINDDDGVSADNYVASFTWKQLHSMSREALIAELKKRGISVPHDVTTQAAIDLLTPLTTARVSTTDDALAAAAGTGMTSQVFETSSDAHVATGDRLSVTVVRQDEFIAPDPYSQVRVPVAASESRTINVPIDNVKRPTPSPKPVVPPPMPAQKTVAIPPITMPRPPLPNTGDLGLAEDKTLNTIPLDVAPNNQGVPVAVDPLRSVIEDPFATPKTTESTTINVVNSNGAGSSTSDVVDGTIQSNLQLEESQQPPEAPTLDVTFTKLETNNQNIGHSVDPLVEYRDLDSEDEEHDDNPDIGCTSSEDAYTGDSQPRIDYVGSSQIVHMQPMLSHWSVYDMESGLATSGGDLSLPYHPHRRTFLGGDDNRFVEHYPITGVYKFFKCETHRFEKCEQYAQGQWERTVHANDVLVSVTDNLVIVVNQDKGTWRLFNFDRDVSGNSDPLSTAMPPMASGSFPDFSDDELVSLGNGLLMTHDPRTDSVQLYRLDIHRKTIVGPTHSGVITTDGAPHRVTGLGDGRVIVFKPRTRTYRVMGCNEQGCSILKVGYLHASAGLDATPVMRQLMSLDTKTSLAWAGSDSLLFVSESNVLSVPASEDVVQNLNPGEIPPSSSISATANVHTVKTRPNHPNDMLLVTLTAHAGDQTQLRLQRGQEVFDVAVDPAYTYTAGQFSPDGQFFSYTATLMERRVENIAEPAGIPPETTVFVIEVESVFNGHANPTAVRVYPFAVTLGPFSHDGHRLTIAVPTADVPQDNNIELVDIMSGKARVLTELPKDREPTLWVANSGAAFDPSGNHLYVLSNENSNFFSLQSIPVSTTTPVGRRIVLQFQGDITHVSFSSDFTRCAVTVSTNGYADFHVFVVNPATGKFSEMKRPFLSNLKCSPTAFVMAPDGSKAAMIKTTADESGQVYMTKIVDLPSSENSTTEAATTHHNATAVRLPIVSIPIRLTKPRLDLPAAILNLPQPISVQFPSADGLPLQAFVFPPNLNPLMNEPIALNVSRLHSNSTNATSIKPEPSLHRLPPYVVFVHDGPKETAPGHLWSSAVTKTLNFLRTLGVGVIAPNVRGSAGFGKRFALMDNKEKRPHVFTDLLETRNFLCGGQFVVDCSNIGVVGVGYGGFAALGAAIAEPDTWKIAVDVSGMTNLITHIKTSRPRANIAAQQNEYGSDSVTLARYSPVQHIESIKADVFVAHGIEDTVVSVDQAEEIASALRAHHRVVKYLSLPGQGHTISGLGDSLLLGGAMADFMLKRLNLLADE